MHCFDENYDDYVKRRMIENDIASNVLRDTNTSDFVTSTYELGCVFWDEWVDAVSAATAAKKKLNTLTLSADVMKNMFSKIEIQYISYILNTARNQNVNVPTLTFYSRLKSSDAETGEITEVVYFYVVPKGDADFEAFLKINAHDDKTALAFDKRQVNASILSLEEYMNELQMINNLSGLASLALLGLMMNYGPNYTLGEEDRT